MGIERIKVRARVEIGSLTVSTPFVKAFNVTKARGQVSTFDATLKVSHDDVKGSMTGDNVKILAGTDSGLSQIFIGMVRKAKISPCWDDPKFVMLSISGEDILSRLRGKKFTRRCRATMSCWTAITGIARRGLKSDKFAFQNLPYLWTDGGGPLSESNRIHYVPGQGGTEERTAPPTNTDPGVFQFSITPHGGTD